MDLRSWGNQKEKIYENEAKLALPFYFFFTLNWSPVRRNVQRRSEQVRHREKSWSIQRRVGENKKYIYNSTNFKTKMTGLKFRRLSVQNEEQCGWKRLGVVPPCGEMPARSSLAERPAEAAAAAAAATGGWAPEWCSPLQQLSATEQRSARQTLDSNSSRGGRERERVGEREMRETERDEGDGG